MVCDSEFAHLIGGEPLFRLPLGYRQHLAKPQSAVPAKVAP
jgi:hypothetical protein